MFFNNKKETTPICTANNGLPECDSVAKIKEYQKQLNDMKIIRQKDLLDEYFMDNRSFSSCIMRIIEDTMEYCIPSHTTCEEYFRNFGKGLDAYNNQQKLKQELTDKIKEEKDKLGIK